MRYWTMLGLALAACTGPLRYSAPAPAGALACAAREAEQLGYRRLEGRVEDGVLRLGLVGGASTREERLGRNERNERLGEVATTDFDDVEPQGQLRLRRVGDQLRIEVLSDPRVKGEDGEPEQRVATHARSILAQCSSPEAASP